MRGLPAHSATRCRSAYANTPASKGGRRGPRLWYFILFGIIVGGIANIVDYGLFHHAAVFAFLIELLLFLPNIAVQVRRLHDLDRTGWWLWIFLVPLVGAILLLVWFCTRGTDGPNRHGPDPLPPRTRFSYATS